MDLFFLLLTYRKEKKRFVSSFKIFIQSRSVRLDP